MTVPGDQVLPAGALEALTELVGRFAKEHHCPSINWGLVTDGRLATTGAAWDDEHMAAPTVDTVYRIASMTKSFTCAAILSLRDEGVLSLDDPITEHAPELAVVQPPTSDAGPIRIRHLMRMSAGLATDDAWADRHLDITDDELDAALAAGALFAGTTGSVFEYSNLGFGLLGRVVKRATGRSVQDEITERLIGPLGLTRTTWVQPDHDDWARPFRVVDDAIAPEGTPLLGDGGIAPMGGIWTTVTDLARWVGWLDSAYPARDGADDGPLCRASRREMQEPQNTMGTVDLPGRVGVNSYGYGLRIRDDERMGRVVMHSGGLPGYGSNMRWASRRRFAMIALANVTYAPMAQLTHEAFELLHEHGAFPAVADVDGPLVVQMGRRLFELWQHWDDDVATELFADNVAPDESFERRLAEVARWRDECGGELVLDRIEPESATSGKLLLARPTGDPITIVFELSPLVPPRLQLVARDD